MCLSRPDGPPPPTRPASDWPEPNVRLLRWPSQPVTRSARGPSHRLWRIPNRPPTSGQSNYLRTPFLRAWLVGSFLRLALETPHPHPGGPSLSPQWRFPCPAVSKHQTPRLFEDSAQPRPRTAGSRIPVFQRTADIRHARPFIEDSTSIPSHPSTEAPDQQFATLSMFDEVGPEFGHDKGDIADRRLIDPRLLGERNGGPPRRGRLTCSVTGTHTCRSVAKPITSTSQCGPSCLRQAPIRSQIR